MKNAINPTHFFWKLPLIRSVSVSLTCDVFKTKVLWRASILGGDKRWLCSGQSEDSSEAIELALEDYNR